MIERKLLDYGLHSGRIVAIHRDPAPAAVTADGVHFHYFFVQQLVNERAVLGNQRNKVFVEGIGE